MITLILFCQLGIVSEFDQCLAEILTQPNVYISQSGKIRQLYPNWQLRLSRCRKAALKKEKQLQNLLDLYEQCNRKFVAAMRDDAGFAELCKCRDQILVARKKLKEQKQ